MVALNPIQKLTSRSFLMKKQKGVVLVVALVFLIALTAVGGALMQNTTTDMKMSGASQEKSVALQEAMSEMDRIIYNQVRRKNGANGFALPMANYPLNPTVYQPAVTTAEIAPANQYKLEVDCPPAANGSDNKLFRCNVLRVQLNRAYGRNKKSDVEVHSSIAQQLIGKGG